MGRISDKIKYSEANVIYNNINLCKSNEELGTLLGGSIYIKKLAYKCCCFKNKFLIHKLGDLRLVHCITYVRA